MYRIDQQLIQSALNLNRLLFMKNYLLFLYVTEITGTIYFQFWVHQSWYEDLLCVYILLIFYCIHVISCSNQLLFLYYYIRTSVRLEWNSLQHFVYINIKIMISTENHIYQSFVTYAHVTCVCSCKLYGVNSFLEQND